LCRLVFVRDRNNNAVMKTLCALKLFEDISGGDGWGISYFDGDNMICKKFVGKVRDSDVRELENLRVKECLGMTRFSTIGVTNLKNQQPIEIKKNGELFGYIVHNGTLYPHRYPEINVKRPTYNREFIKNKFLWREKEKISDTNLIANEIGLFLSDDRTIGEYFLCKHPKDQTVMILTKDHELYLHRGHNPLRFFVNETFVFINNLWGATLDRSSYVLNGNSFTKIVKKKDIGDHFGE